MLGRGQCPGGHPATAPQYTRNTEFLGEASAQPPRPGGHPVGRISSNLKDQQRDCIWGDRFIELKSLLNRGDSEERAQFLVAKGVRITIEAEGCRKGREFLSIEEWTNVFLIFMDVHLEKFLGMAHEMLCYLAHARELGRRGLGS